MIINLSTPPEAMLSELRRYYPKARYWLERMMKHRDVRDEIERRARVLHGNMLLDTADLSFRDTLSSAAIYSPKGSSPWVVSFHVERVGNGTQVHPICVCYYETVGGCGFFLPSFFNVTGATEQFGVSTEVAHCSIFTSHCCQRFKERTGAVENGTDLVLRVALAAMGERCFMHSVPNRHGSHTAILKTPSGYFLGFFRLRDEEHGQSVIELRTFLTDAMLSPKQRFMLSNVNSMSDLHQRHTLRTGDEELYRYWYYNGLRDNDEMIGRILLLRTMSVICQHISRKMERLGRHMEMMVTKHISFFDRHPDVVKRVGATGCLTEDDKDEVLAFILSLASTNYGIDIDDNVAMYSLLQVANEGLEKVKSIDYLSRGREILLAELPEWKKQYLQYSRKTNKLLNSKH